MPPLLHYHILGAVIVKHDYGTNLYIPKKTPQWTLPGKVAISHHELPNVFICVVLDLTGKSRHFTSNFCMLDNS